MPNQPLATVWLSRSKPVQQLTRFLYDFAKNYAALSAGDSPKRVNKISRIFEAYFRSRRPVMSKLLRSVKVDKLEPQVIAIMDPIPGPDTARAVMEKHLGPVGDLVLSRQYHRSLSPPDFIDVFGHEGMHAAQLWRRSRGVDPSKIADMPWYWEQNRQRGYARNPFEVQARAAGRRTAKDFGNFLKSVEKAVDEGTLQGAPRDIAIDLLRAVNWRTVSPDRDVPDWVIPTLESLK